MSFCDKHWQELLDQVKERGLNKFLSDSEEGLKYLAFRQSVGQTTVIDFEPIMLSMQLIINFARSIYGDRLAVPDEKTGATPCPVCMITETSWAEWASYLVLGEADRRGLMSQEPKILLLGDA